MAVSKWATVMSLTEQTTAGGRGQGGVIWLYSRLGQEEGSP